MSGGAFDYAFSRVSNFADELECKIEKCDEVDQWGDKPNYFEPEVIAKLRQIKAIAEHAALLMKEVEWLYSGDTGEESFSRRVREIQAKRGAK